jgi:Arc/MetJ-type ribon-helix-helix transcriptional regulator
MPKETIDEQRTEQINVRLTRSEVAALDDFRAAQRASGGIPSRSDVVRDAVLAYVKSEKKRRT